MSELNVTELDRVIAMIQSHTEEHDQRTWCYVPNENDYTDYCGTTACVAGWTCIMNGRTQVVPTQWGTNEIVLIQDDPYKQPQGWADQAQTILGLNWSERQELFYNALNLEDVIWTVDKIKDGYFR